MGDVPARIRVRGIYATALTRLLLDEGFVVTQASRVIRERLGLPDPGLPADATVKDSGRDASELLVVGPRGGEVAGALRRRLPYSVFWESPLGLYSTVSYRVRERAGDRCLVELPGGAEGVLAPCGGGGEGLATVVKAPVKPFERAGLRPGASVSGLYAVVSEAGGVSVSEHIRSPERRAELLALASRLAGGLGIRWRSNAGLGAPEELAGELERLAAELRRLVERYRSGERGVLWAGEYIGMVGLGSPSKELLDEVRGRVVPTVPGHHSLKSVSREMGMLVDYSETLLARGVERRLVGEALLDYVVGLMGESRRIDVVHRTLDGRVRRLTPGRLQSALPTSRGYRLEIRRVFRSSGVYDGLGVERRPGDYDVMVVETGRWRIIHRYYSASGELLGEYVNINTPPELRPGAVEYVDLAVDVVRRPGGKPEIIDGEELEEAWRRGVVPEPLYRRALEEALAAASSRAPEPLKTRGGDTQQR